MGRSNSNDMSDHFALIKRPLKQSLAVAFVRRQLQNGLELARLISILHVDNASYWAYLPSDVSDDAAHDFVTALGMSPPPAKVAGSAVRIQPALGDATPVVDDLMERLRAKDAVLVVEDHIRTATSGGTSVAREPCTVTHGQDLYYVVTADRASARSVGAALEAGTSYMAVAAVTVPLTEIDIRCGADLSDGELRLIAAATSAIVIGAYDREGYVIGLLEP